uniref:Uncharacterized protein n=1 Tax=Callithrix jacchus TaxID=9483 RepID=A0A8I3W0K4_CALJA
AFCAQLPPDTDGCIAAAPICISQGDQPKRRVISALPTEVTGSSHSDWLDSGCSPWRVSRNRMGCCLTQEVQGARGLPPLTKGNCEGVCYPAQILCFSQEFCNPQTRRFLCVPTQPGP